MGTDWKIFSKTLANQIKIGISYIKLQKDGGIF